MTVNSSTARQQYNGNGVTTAFTVPFRFLDNTHLQVIRTSAAGVDTTLVLSTDYTVTGAGAATGTITMVTAPASGEKLTIVRSMPFSQQIDLVNGDPLPAETLEAGLDARAMEAQQLKDSISRSLSLPTSSSASAVLPEAIPLALLGWNATGDALQSFAGAAGSPVSSFMAPAVAAADATAAQTAIGGTSVGRSVFSAANAAAARTALTAAASGANGDITSLSGLTTPISLIALRSYLSGCTLSTAGASTTMSIAAGVAMDSTNTFLMQLAATSKTTSNWSVGSAAGGLDTGTIANSTWYYFYAIRRPDTGVVDVVFSTNSTSPTLPTNYTQFRYIGAGLTNGSGQWTKFYQIGDEFFWDVQPLDVNASLSTTPTNYTLSVPRRVVKANMSVFAAAPSTNAVDIRMWNPSITDAASASSSLATLSITAQSAGSPTRITSPVSCFTNASAQVRAVCLTSTTVEIRTTGWIDLRGKDL